MIVSRHIPTTPDRGGINPSVSLGLGIYPSSSVDRSSQPASPTSGYNSETNPRIQPASTVGALHQPCQDFTDPGVASNLVLGT